MRRAGTKSGIAEMVAVLALAAAGAWLVYTCWFDENYHATSGKPYRWELDHRPGAYPPDHPGYAAKKAELDAAELRAAGLTP